MWFLASVPCGVNLVWAEQQTSMKCLVFFCYANLLFSCRRSAITLMLTRLMLVHKKRSPCIVLSLSIIQPSPSTVTAGPLQPNPAHLHLSLSLSLSLCSANLRNFMHLQTHHRCLFLFVGIQSRSTSSITVFLLVGPRRLAPLQPGDVSSILILSALLDAVPTASYGLEICIDTRLKIDGSPAS